ncbi:MAG TPA: sigma-70 family RNA polymerase sigma factor [Terriglobales bacterium]|nr:sigma-70 family RNA polymerase sigma factor [Terriglobales bacterium]
MNPAAAGAQQVVDADLLRACQRGDRHAFRVLFEAYRDRVYSIALHFTGDSAVAADVTQDVFVKLFHAIGKFRFDSDFGTWLYRLVANVCMDEHRRRRRWLPLEDVFMSPSRSQEKAAMRSEMSGAVQAAVARLAPRLRLPILLRYVEGLSYDQIAGALGCSKGTVASRLNRAHKILARRLSYLRNQVPAEGEHV